MKKLLAVALCLMVIAGASGCANTVDGAGEDIEQMGEWMQRQVN